MTSANHAATPDAAPRHAALFELIRQHRLAAMRAKAAAKPAAPAHSDPERPATAPLSMEEQHALGITASFGR